MSRLKCVAGIITYRNFFVAVTNRGAFVEGSRSLADL